MAVVTVSCRKHVYVDCPTEIHPVKVKAFYYQIADNEKVFGLGLTWLMLILPKKKDPPPFF